MSGPLRDAPYLRMTQRDEGKGVVGHPRLRAGANASASLSAQTAPRLGAANNYGEPPIRDPYGS